MSKQLEVYVLTYSSGPTLVVDREEIQGIDLDIHIGDSLKIEKVLMSEEEFEKLQEY